MGPKVSTTTLSHHTSSPPGPHPLGDYCRGLFSSIRGCCPIPNPYPAQNQAPKAGFRFFLAPNPTPTCIIERPHQPPPPPLSLHPTSPLHRLLQPFPTARP